MHYAAMSVTALDRAIQTTGGAEAFAEAVGVSRRTVFNWKAVRIPADRVPDVERITGIPRHELRPDLWDAPAAQPSAA